MSDPAPVSTPTAGAAPAASGAPSTTPAATVQTGASGAPASSGASAAPASTATPAAPAANAAPAAPAPWTPTVPPGSLVDPGYVQGLQRFAAEKGLAPEVAQAFLDHQHQQMQTVIAQAQAERQAWEQDLAKDATIGGERLQAARAQALGAADKLFGPHAAAFKELLTATGYDANPTLVRALYHASTLLRDDSIAGKTGASAADKPTEEQRLRALYPSMFT